MAGYVFNKRYASTELLIPDFVMIANAYNIPAEKVSKEKNSKVHWKKCLLKNGPFLLDIVIEKEGNVFPMVEPGSSVSEVRLTYLIIIL